LTGFVVDASVAVKWVVEEIHFQSARRLLAKSYELLVPYFFFAEVANVFWKRVNRRENSADDAKLALEAIKAQPLQVYSARVLMVDAFDMAIQTQRAVYACVYLTLAVKHKGQMVTADQKLFNALQNSSLAAYLHWVEDLPS